MPPRIRHSASMPLDADLAERLLGTDDRDVARFFAGREAEIASFDTAVRFAADKARAHARPQATFRIYQGAPGCGKTSLANHLARTRARDILFVTVDPEHLRNADALRMRIRAASLSSGHSASRVGSAFVEMVSAHLKSAVAADGLRAEARKLVARGTSCLVLHLDEAHARALACADVLRDLHASGVGVPCVVLLTASATPSEPWRRFRGCHGLETTPWLRWARCRLPNAPSRRLPSSTR